MAHGDQTQGGCNQLTQNDTNIPYPKPLIAIVATLLSISLIVSDKLSRPPRTPAIWLQQVQQSGAGVLIS